jgi:hypothetical protein
MMRGKEGEKNSRSRPSFSRELLLVCCLIAAVYAGDNILII